MHNDAPWGRATAEDAHECKSKFYAFLEKILHKLFIYMFFWCYTECNCNGFSERCFFDKELYELTGHGGHCLECSHNRDGAQCERCRPNYYQPQGEMACYPCNCNETGTYNTNLLYVAIVNIFLFNL